MQELVWNDISMKFIGIRLTGLRGYEIKPTVEKDALYGEGGEPLSIQAGNSGYSGQIKVLKNDFNRITDACIAAGYTDITKVPAELITITAVEAASPLRRSRLETCVGVGFTESGTGMEQGAKMMEITLPFIAMRVFRV